MAWTKQIKIESVLTQNEFSHENAVFVINWIIVGTNENNITAETRGLSRLSSKDVAPENFIPFEQLTKEVVEGWINQDLANKNINVDSLLDKQLAKTQINHFSKANLPWADPSAFVSAGDYA